MRRLCVLTVEPQLSDPWFDTVCIITVLEPHRVTSAPPMRSQIVVVRLFCHSPQDVCSPFPPTRPRPVADEHLASLLDTKMYRRTRAGVLFVAYATTAIYVDVPRTQRTAAWTDSPSSAQAGPGQVSRTSTVNCPRSTDLRLQMGAGRIPDPPRSAPSEQSSCLADKEWDATG